MRAPELAAQIAPVNVRVDKANWRSFFASDMIDGGEMNRGFFTIWFLPDVYCGKSRGGSVTFSPLRGSNARHHDPDWFGLVTRQTSQSMPITMQIGLVGRTTELGCIDLYVI